MRISTRLKLGYLGVAAVDTWLAGAAARGHYLRGARLARSARFVTKPALMPLLAASFATDRRAFPSPLRSTTLAGQVFGWGGDLALLGRGNRSFAVGAGSFGLGHAAYIAGFVPHRSPAPFFGASTTRAALRAWAVAGPVMAVAGARKERALGPAVAAYTGLLWGTFATGAHLSPSLRASSRRLTAVGAGLFLLSDTVLGVRQFVLPWMLRSGPSHRMDAALERVVMGSYTAAQLLLAEGAARAGSGVPARHGATDR